MFILTNLFSFFFLCSHHIFSGNQCEVSYSDSFCLKSTLSGVNLVFFLAWKLK